MKKSEKRWLRSLFAGCLTLMMIISIVGCSGKKNETAGADEPSPGFAQPGRAESAGDQDESRSEEETVNVSGDTWETESGERVTESETTPVETEPPIVFADVEEKVYAADRLNIRFEPSTAAEILRTMYMGEEVVRTGVSEEWSRILYNGEEYFVASAYLSMEPVIADTLSGRVDQLLRQMAVASETDQLVLAVGQNDGGDRCTVFYYTKDGDGNWNKRFETEGFWGFNGVKKVILEADGCTPIGCFPFRFAYGINEDPGSVMEYKQATPTAYMVDDVNSKYYNLWVDTADPNIVQDWKTAEHVIDFPTSYNYGLFIDNNPTCDPTQGSSVICIHCTSPRGFSPGCINIAQEHILTLVTELDYSSRMVIVYGVEDLAEY
ncbi:MAG: SH3 domain-containing protein [Lachnospiraceae bacterium]|nr:SH3 domain-containing protein [Lachnospiraceae bacterium]